jgi:ferredoxin
MSNTRKQRLFVMFPLAMLSTNYMIGSSGTCRALCLVPQMQRGGRQRCGSGDRTRRLGTIRFMSSADAEHGASSCSDLPRRQEHTVTFRSAADKPDIIFSAIDGEILRTACLRRGLVSPHNGNARLINCRGLGTCGTCAVEIEASTADVDVLPSIEPLQRNNVENLRLTFPPHGSGDQSPKLRLACQVQVRGDVVVTKRAGFWGQASSGDGGVDPAGEETMVDPSTCKTYFGELEFLLDRRSPQQSEDSSDGT